MIEMVSIMSDDRSFLPSPTRLLPRCLIPADFPAKRNIINLSWKETLIAKSLFAFKAEYYQSVKKNYKAII